MTEHDGVRTESATEELRRMLDERGVEWQGKPELIISGIEKGTEFDAADGRLVRAVEALDGTICLSHITPEQAIAATLGTGTCHVTDNGPWGYPYVCSACGASFDPDVNNGELNYCPNCGRRVEVDDG